MPAQRHDWPAVRRRLNSYSWYCLGKNVPYTEISMLALGRVQGMEDVQVTTRDNRFDARGKRYCTAYLKFREEK